MRRLFRPLVLVVCLVGLLLVGFPASADMLGGQLFATGGEVTVEILPSTAGFTSELWLHESTAPYNRVVLIGTNREVGKVVNLGSFPTGQELVFGIYVRDTGDTFLIGPADRNPDMIPHADVIFLGSGDALVGFEDLLGGGDRDYDDNIFRFTGGIAPEPVITAAVDVHPRSCPNPVNLGSRGVLPVALLGTADFDVTRVDPASLRLEGLEPVRWAAEDVTAPYGGDGSGAMHCSTADADGYMDLTLKFDMEMVAAALGAAADGEVRVLHLTGRLWPEHGGTELAGTDVVVIINNQ